MPNAMQTIADPSHPVPWQVFLLGGLRISFQGQPVPALPFRCQALLALLLLRPAQNKREQLAGMLFPDSPEDAAKARLSDRLWLLKKHLPEFPLAATGTDIRVDHSQVWVDVNEFRLLARNSDRHSLAQAIALYAGPLLPEQDAEWLLLERENLYLTYIRALQLLGALVMKSGNPREAVPLLERLQAIEPFDENNLRNLLRTYQAIGQRGAALATFDKFQVMLRNEMDLEPEPATLEIIQAIRTQAISRPAPSLETEITDTPSDLFRRGQKALWRGDFDALPGYVQALRNNHEEVLPGAADSLEAEYAILRGDYELARQLLGKYSTAIPLCITVQQIHLLVELKEYSDVLPKCKPAILEAHRQNDRVAEMLLLANQGSAFQRNGNGLEAMRCANQVVTQAEKESIPYLLGRGLLLKGNLQVGQGFERDALETYHHAAAYASEHGFRPLLCRVEGKLGIAYQQTGQYRLSIEHYQKALLIARDQGMKREEAETLQNLAIVLAYQGRNEESILEIRQARDILATLKDEQGMARNTYHLAFGLALCEPPNLDEALILGRQALEIFQKHQSLGWVASCYGMLGYICWLNNEPEAAIEACKKAIPIYQQLEEADYIPELYGYIGLAYLQLADPRKAIEYTTSAMDEMMRSELYDIASEIYYAHALVLDALGQQEDANEYFRRGYENLLTYAAEIEDPEARQAFFRRDPTVRHLVDQVYARGLAPNPKVETHILPSRGSSPVRVALTVDAGAPDAALKNASGALSLRRARLLRILREARTQGGEPSLGQIASMMKVSLRTVQRDISYLEEQGDWSG